MKREEKNKTGRIKTGQIRFFFFYFIFVVVDDDDDDN